MHSHCVYDAKKSTLDSSPSTSLPLPWVLTQPQTGSTVEPLYTFGDQHFVPYSEVSHSGASGIFPGRHGMRNPAVEYNMDAFSELSFAVRWQGRPSRG